MEHKQYDITYTIFSDEGQILDSNVNEKPVPITLGKGEFLPYVEEELAKLNTGDEKTIVIPPEKGFGDHKAILVKDTGRDNLPPQWQKVGTLVELVDEEGVQRNAKVTAVSDETVTLDFNHPFAGIKLICSIKVVQARP